MKTSCSIAVKVIRKVLIANRGEIAVRIAHTCREMRMGVVAVYSEADRQALHVRMADQAVCIGPPAPRESYLSIDRIIDAARQTGCDAVHPGYGFLSENTAFAQAVIDAGLIFIGPDPAAIRAMGDKTVARQTMRASGVPLVPGDDGGDGGFPNAASALSAAHKLGFPVMIKARAGGGGKGMRLVADPARFERDFAAAQREAASAFGNDTVYLEKFIEQPRHVEIQIFADRHGQTVHLFERDCSIQRRHQKVIEETPSPAPAMNDALCMRIGEIAARAARAIGYVGAGTMEFLLAPDGAFYFLEMNTRLQVEHPITEWVTGIDLVRWQLVVATGERLPLQQEQITRRGAAIECRLYAEDPVRFLPSPGTISLFRMPSGPGVRLDSGFEAGSEITPYYDPLIAKLTVWHETRSLALARAQRALLETTIGGIQSNVSLHQVVLSHPAFVAGRYDTGFLERYKAELVPSAPDQRTLDLALATAVIEAEKQRATNHEAHTPTTSAWRRTFQPRPR